MVMVIKSLDEFETALEEAASKGQLVVVDFFAEWCGPCKVLAPKLDALSKESSEVVFLKVDVDHNETLAQQYQISAMPTLILIKNKVQVDQIVGANLNLLKSKIAQHTGAPALAAA